MALSCLFMAPRLETLVRTCVDALTVSVGVGLELGWCLLWPLCGSALSAWTGRRGEQGLDSAYSFCRASRRSGRCLCTGTLRKRFTTGPDGRSQYRLVGPDAGAPANDALREFIAEPGTPHAELRQRGEERFLQIDPGSLRPAER